VGRPSLADVRRPQILDAFEACIVKYGLAGSSLERIAEEAGVKRSLIRHYFGNRSGLTEALIDRVLQAVVDEYQRLIAQAGAAGDLDAVISYLTGPGFAGDPADAVIDALMDEAHRDAYARAVLRHDYAALLSATEQVLAQIRPKVRSEDIRTAAYALVCLGIGSADMHTIRLPARKRGDAQRAATLLAEVLLGGSATRRR
jgi:AcrR family transcriptional regulator